MTTKFSGNNPFTGEAIVAKTKKTKARSQFVDVTSLVITSDPLPVGRSSVIENKYQKVFELMKVGQCIKCQPSESSKIAHALNVWLEKQGRKNTVKSCRHYDSDALGRVWLLEPVKRALKVAA